MAAVFALVMLPLLAALGFFAGVTRSEGSFSSGFAMLTLVGLGSLIFFGALKIMREVEESP